MRGEGSLYKRGEVFWVSFYHDGQTHRESTGKTDENEANKYLKNLRDELGAARIGARTFTSAKSSRLRVRELVDALEADFTLRGKLSPQNKSHLKRVKDDFGHYRAVDLKPEVIDAYIEKRIAKGDAKASVNRCTQLLSQSFTLAIQRGHLSRAPHVRKLSEADNVRKISVSETQLADFLAALPDDGLRDFAQWCAACAMRSGEAKKLTWQMLHGDELRIPGKNCKNGESRVVPVCDELGEIIERRRSRRKMDCQFIFHRDGVPVNEYRKAVATARRKANLPNGETAQERFVLHSLRSVAATNLIHAGVAPPVAMKVGGWKTDSMLHRYTILTTDDVRDALTQTGKYRASEKAKSAKVVAMR
jgi:integrase